MPTLTAETSTTKNPQSEGSTKSATKAKRRQNKSKSRKAGGPQLDQGLLKELADIRDAEMQLVKALPKVLHAAQAPPLREALKKHLQETKEHVRRTQQVFRAFGQKPKAKRCAGMAGILAEGKKILKEGKPSSARDALLIAAAQKVEHYEIAVYGSLIAWCRVLGNQRALNLLEDTLEDEKQADKHLSQIAEEALNLKADSGNEHRGNNREGERNDMSYDRETERWDRPERSSRSDELERDEYGRFESEGRSRGDYEDWDERSGSRSRQSSAREESGRSSGRSSQGYDDDERSGSRSRQGSQSRERDEYGRFESEGRSSRGRSNGDDDDERSGSRSRQGSQSREREYGGRSSSRSSRGYDDDERSSSRSGRGRSDYDEERSGSRSRQGSQSRERDEYGRFESEGRSSRGRSNGDDDDDERSGSGSRQGSQSREREYGGRSSSRSSRGYDDDERSSSRSGRGRSDDDEEEYAGSSSSGRRSR
jgi:ferritin-like metal-binding protein YciE